MSASRAVGAAQPHVDRLAPAPPTELSRAIDRAAGARPIGGNRLEHYADSPRAPVRLVFPAALASRWMPGLFPEQGEHA